MTDAFIHITSRDNALYKQLKTLTERGTAWRKQGRIWLEGDHLCRAAVARGLQPLMWLQRADVPLPHEFAALRAKTAIKIIAIDAPLWNALSGLESPSAMACLLPLPDAPALDPHAATLVLDRVQDAGNVGAMLRSASAFGFKQVLALAGTASLWSPKVLRAGMGAHFGLNLIDGATADDVAALAVPRVVTSSHQGAFLHQQTPPFPCALIMGHEGQGVGPELMALANHHVRIAQPGGEESLNVGAAAAICLHGIRMASNAS